MSAEYQVPRGALEERRKVLSGVEDTPKRRFREAGPFFPRPIIDAVFLSRCPVCGAGPVVVRLVSSVIHRETERVEFVLFVRKKAAGFPREGDEVTEKVT
ncbi:Tat pathway signal protein [Anopheles sinensis]|uniref:Tat pathway signal protein n=1 Tax=Anopheles sinensis TaxID=74873 RepID=A0A084VJK8_ANOSI|nr:Tat pathway signal protein [Anopheles sinensis]